MSLKGKIIRVAIVLLVLLLPVAIWRWMLTRDVNQRLAAMRAAGLPTNGKELNTYYAPVPDNQNAALVLTQAYALLKQFPDKRSEAIRKLKDTFPRRGQRLTPEQTELIREYVQMNPAALAKVEEAIRLPRSRYPVDGSMLSNTLLPHLGQLGELANLFQCRAVLGTEAEADAATKTILGVARTLEEEPIMISQVVHSRLLRMAVMTLERRLNAGDLT